MAGAFHSLHRALYTQQCFTAFLCHRSYTQSPPRVSVCLLSISVWILFEPLLPFHNLCPKVSLSSKLSSKCIHAHMHKACSLMPTPKALCTERVMVGVPLQQETVKFQCCKCTLAKLAVWRSLTSRNCWGNTLICFAGESFMRGLLYHSHIFAVIRSYSQERMSVI